MSEFKRTKQDQGLGGRPFCEGESKNSWNWTLVSLTNLLSYFPSSLLPAALAIEPGEYGMNLITLGVPFLLVLDPLLELVDDPEVKEKDA